jgi:RimJ/RimL family protein N-acetyltransferase
MQLTVRPMTFDESGLIVDYFHSASPEHLELMGVDPTRMPPRDAWRRRMEAEFALPVEQRSGFVVIWLDGETPIGFSSCDRIKFGERANMHLHVVDAGNRNQGAGAQCVRRSVDIYFDMLKLKRLFCEPNAFNVAPNRTLQRAGFRYIKTHMTVPGPLNYHQAVTQWVIER